VVDRMQQRSRITVRNLNLSDFDNEVRRIDSIYRTAWEHNWGFVPMTEEEFFFMARRLKQIVDPKLVYIAEHNGSPVAFSLAIPDVNEALIYLKGRLFPFGLAKLLWHTKVKNKIDSIRLVMLGVIPAFRKRGIDSMLYVATYRRGVQLGYTWAELSWILETNNLMCRAIEQMGGKVYKRYRIMEVPLQFE
jgi:GNAT superfamily N-acetyltransferase